MMKHELVFRRRRYADARKCLSSVNQLSNKYGPLTDTKSSVMKSLNHTRNELRKEIKRVSWLVWPETGRPHTGDWQVINKLINSPVFEGSLLRCIAFVDRSRYGVYYQWIRKPE